MSATTAACGHRGNASDRPEQTLVAYARAVELGASCIELDVRCSADGELVVIHDATLERTTDGVGAVADATSAELLRLDAGSWFADDYTGERIPTLDEVVEFAAGQQVTLCIEVKADSTDDAVVTAQRLASWLAEHRQLDQVLVSSFHLDALAEAAARTSGLRLLPWMDEFQPADVAAHVRDARRLDAEGVFHTASLLSASQVGELKRAGLAVWVWSADDAASLRHAVSLGADVVSCSDIAALTAQLDEAAR